MRRLRWRAGGARDEAHVAGASSAGADDGGGLRLLLSFCCPAGAGLSAALCRAGGVERGASGGVGALRLVARELKSEVAGDGQLLGPEARHARVYVAQPHVSQEAAGARAAGRTHAAAFVVDLADPSSLAAACCAQRRLLEARREEWRAVKNREEDELEDGQQERLPPYATALLTLNASSLQRVSAEELKMLVDSRGFALALPLPSPHVVTGEDGLTRLDAALASLAEFLACMRQAEAASRLPDGPQPSLRMSELLALGEDDMLSPPLLGRRARALLGVIAAAGRKASAAKDGELPPLLAAAAVPSAHAARIASGEWPASQASPAEAVGALRHLVSSLPEPLLPRTLQKGQATSAFKLAAGAGFHKDGHQRTRAWKLALAATPRPAVRLIAAIVEALHSGGTVGEGRESLFHDEWQGAALAELLFGRPKTWGLEIGEVAAVAHAHAASARHLLVEGCEAVPCLRQALLPWPRA